MAVVSQIMTTDGSLHTLSASALTYTNYGVCSTAGATAAKVVNVNNDNFTLSVGASIHVKFSNTNYAESPTLAVNGTEAKPIVTNGTKSVARGGAAWASNSVVELVYDGTSWVLNDWINTNDVYYGSQNVVIEDLDTYGLYDELVELYNSSSTYFSVGFYPPDQNNVDFEIRYYQPSTIGNWYLFGFVGGTATQYRYGLVQPTNTSSAKFHFCWRDKGNAYLESAVPRTGGHNYRIKASLHNGTATLYVKDENTGVSDLKTTTYTTTNVNTLANNLRLFSGGSSSYAAQSSLYVQYVSLVCNGQTLLSYLPRRRKSDNIVGFLNIVSGSFLSSDSGNVAANKLNAGQTIDRLNNHIIKVSSSVDDSNFVHKTDAEIVGGEKTFTNNMTLSSGASINFDLGNDEGLYIQALSDNNGKQVTFADSDDDSEIRITNVADPIDPLDAVNKAYMEAAIAGGSSGITLPLGIPDGGTGRTTAKGAEFAMTTDLGTELTSAIGDSYRIPFLNTSASYSNGRFAGYRKVTLLWNYILDKITSLLGISYNSNNEGIPLAPTAADGTNTTQIATTAFVQNAKNEITNKMVVLDGRSGQYGIHQKSLCASASINNDAAYRMTSFTTTSGTHTSKSSDVGAGFPIGCNIYYHPDDTDFNGNTEFVAKKFYSSYDSVDARYSAIDGYNVSLSSGIASNVYLKVVIIYGGTRWAPYYNKDSAYEIIATSDDLEADNFYIYLGKVSSSNAYSFQLEENNPLYYYNGTQLVNWATYIAESRITTYTAGDGISISNGVISVDADDELDPDATTPVQNGVVTSAIEDIEATILYMGRVWVKPIDTPLYLVDDGTYLTPEVSVSMNPSSGNAIRIKGLYRISANFRLAKYSGNTSEVDVQLMAIANGASTPATIYSVRISVGNSTPGTCHVDAFIYLSSGVLIPSLKIKRAVSGGTVVVGDDGTSIINGSFLSAEYIGSNNYISA